MASPNTYDDNVVNSVNIMRLIQIAFKVNKKLALSYIK